jgi:hypothetical protein
VNNAGKNFIFLDFLVFARCAFGRAGLGGMYEIGQRGASIPQPILPHTFPTKVIAE